MDEKRKIASWLDVFQEYPLPTGISEKHGRKNALILDDALHTLWNLGHNLIQLWAQDEGGMFLLVIPHYRLEEFAAREHLVEEILSSPKMTTPERLILAARVLKTEATRISLPFTPGEGLSNDLISGLIHRYGISLVKDRAVALFDIVGFSLLSPLEQVTQLNSLSYSVNSAQHKLMERSIDIRFARSSTGDGFYIWNRASDCKANIDLFDLMQLVLADNLIAQQKARGKTVPILKTCFNIGPHYEYYQAIGFDLSTFSYIVGDTSIELARMIEKCQPNQILIRDFGIQMHVSGRSGKRMDTIGFIREVQKAQVQLQGVDLSGRTIESVTCHLTGSADDEGRTIRKYRITDKHRRTRSVYNIRVDISLAGSAMLSLGLSPSELAAFEDLGTVRYTDIIGGDG
jgi:hypothetical protein